MSVDDPHPGAATRGPSGTVMALLTLLAAIILLASAGATWTEDVVAVPFGTGETTGPGIAETVVVERVETTSGAELAGGLFTVGLASMALAGPLVRWRQTGYALMIAAVAGVAMTVVNWPASQSVTTAPTVAIAASVGLGALGVIAVRPRRTGDAPDPGPEPPSRYTVEAVRAEPGTSEDEWDAAVLDETPPDPHQKDDNR